METETIKVEVELEVTEIQSILAGLDALVRAGGQGLDSSAGLIETARRLHEAANPKSAGGDVSGS